MSTSGDKIAVKMQMAAACAGLLLLGALAIVVALPLVYVDPDSIFLYSTNVALPVGSLGSRAATTAYCAALAGRPAKCGPNSQMFLSYVLSPISVTTPLRPVRGPTGVVVANSFTALISPSVALVNTLVAAGLGDTGEGICTAWTGMASGGAISTGDNCADFTVTTGNTKVGNYSTTVQPWYSGAVLAPCATPRCVLCVCY